MDELQDQIFKAQEQLLELKFEKETSDLQKEVKNRAKLLQLNRRHM